MMLEEYVASKLLEYHYQELEVANQEAWKSPRKRNRVLLMLLQALHLSGGK